MVSGISAKWLAGVPMKATWGCLALSERATSIKPVSSCEGSKNNCPIIYYCVSSQPKGPLGKELQICICLCRHSRLISLKYNNLFELRAKYILEQFLMLNHGWVDAQVPFHLPKAPSSHQRSLFHLALEHCARSKRPSHVCESFKRKHTHENDYTISLLLHYVNSPASSLQTRATGYFSSIHNSWI